MAPARSEKGLHSTRPLVTRRVWRASSEARLMALHTTTHTATQQQRWRERRSRTQRLVSPRCAAGCVVCLTAVEWFAAVSSPCCRVRSAPPCSPARIRSIARAQRSAEIGTWRCAPREHSDCAHWSASNGSDARRRDWQGNENRARHEAGAARGHTTLSAKHLGTRRTAQGGCSLLLAVALVCYSLTLLPRTPLQFREWLLLFLPLLSLPFPLLTRRGMRPPGCELSRLRLTHARSTLMTSRRSASPCGPAPPAPSREASTSQVETSSSSTMQVSSTRCIAVRYSIRAPRRSA